MTADDASEFVDDLRVPTAVRSPDVKVDGYHHHRGQASVERHRRRDACLQAHSCSVIRVTREFVTQRSEAVAARLAGALAHRH